MKPSSWCPACPTCACAVAPVALISCPFLLSAAPASSLQAWPRPPASPPPSGSPPPTWRTPRAGARRSSRASRSDRTRTAPRTATRTCPASSPRTTGRSRGLLHTELGDEEAVDHVLRPEVHPDDFVDGHVHLVQEDRVVARVGDLPVELLGRHVDVEV